ncbi:MAG: SIR2 family protein [Blastocatellia bacterium]
MEFLKPLFEEQVTTEVSASGEIVIGGITLSPIRILKQTETYEQAFKNWKDDHFELCLIKAEEILKLFDNRARYSRLLNTFERNGFVLPFVGAGMSCPSGFRTWTEYLWMLQSESHILPDELKALIDSGQYDLAAERLLADLGERLFNERLHTSYRASRETPVNGAVHYLPLLFNKSVITTNFDNVLESVYLANNFGFTRFLHGTDGQALNRFLAEGEFCLYKIHGDFALPSTRILTAREYDVAYANDSPLTETLKWVLRSYTFLFLGCSLNQDRTMQLMQLLAREVADLPTHYAFLATPTDDDERRIRGKVLAERNIFPIWYPAEEHDESIEALFVKLLSDMNAL